jgi:cation transport ATPase
VVEYDRAHEPLLEGFLARLRAASPRELAALVAGAKAAATASPAVSQHLPSPKPAAAKPAAHRPAAGLTKGEVPGLFSSQSPLGLPTLSLLMALSANPVVIAVNMPLMLWNAIPIAKRAWRVWSNERRLNVDFLDTLAISASVMQANPLAGSLVTWLIKLGDWIRDLTAAGSRRAISGLLEFRSKSAWILRDGQITAIPRRSSRSAISSSSIPAR